MPYQNIWVSPLNRSGHILKNTQHFFSQELKKKIQSFLNFLMITIGMNSNNFLGAELTE
jgi:hypothetical protein